MPLILASRPALLELVLERAERLIRRPANGPHKGDAILDYRFEILAHEPVLQFDIGARVRKPEKLLGSLKIGPHYALDEAVYPLLQILQAAAHGTREHQQRPNVLGRALNRLGHLAAELFELLGCILDDLPLALGQILRPLADVLAAHPAGAIHGVGANLANTASGIGSELTSASNGIAGRATAGLHGLSGLARGILLRVISHVFSCLETILKVLRRRVRAFCCGAQGLVGQIALGRKHELGMACMVHLQAPAP